MTARLPSFSALANRAQFPLRAPTVPRGVDPLPGDKRTGADYETDWARRKPARAVRVLAVEGVMRPLAHVLARPTVRGLDRLDDLEGPAIFAANHHSHVDTPLLLSTIPEPWQHRLVVAAAADYFFGTRVTGALSALLIGAIPIERKTISRRSAELPADLVRDGWSLLIYPEGGRSKDGWGQPFRGGAAYLAAKTGVPIVPIHIGGTGRILRKGRSLPSPSPSTVTFGDPMWPRAKDDAREVAARLEATVGALADEVASDWWQARRRAHAASTPALAGPAAPAPWRRAWALGDRTARDRARRRRWPDF